MKTIIKIIKSLFLIVLLETVVFSCDSNRIFDEFKPIEKNLWFSNNTIEFNVPSTDTISKNNVFITIRNNKDYEFSSLFLITKMKFPSGNKVIDTLEYEMTDAFGNWLGKGFTDLKENKLIYKQHVIFSEKGNYQFEISQATRSASDIEGKKPLQGITDVGLRIEKIK